jgi:hypothetical protein
MQFLSIAWFVLAAALAILALRRVRALPSGSGVRIMVLLLTCAAAPLILFAWWGQFSVAGHRAFDEMDALYPFAAGALGLLLTIVAALCGWLATRGRGSQA